MINLLTPKILNVMRNSLYEASASLTFYKVTPAAGEAQLFTTTSGWYAQRDSARLSDVSGSLTIWIAKDGASFPVGDQLHVGAKVVIDANGRTQAYRVNEIKTMQQLGTGWVLRCEPTENSTEPNND